MSAARLLLVLLILFSTGHSVYAEYALDLARAVTWQGNVGVTGGIPSYSCSTTIAANSSAATINTALSNAAANTAVCLQAGDGTWTAAVDIPSNKVLRGSKDASGNPTTLISMSWPWPAGVQLGGDWADPALCVAVSTDTTKGATSLTTASSPACLTAGAILYISELDDVGAGLRYRHDYLDILRNHR